MAAIQGQPETATVPQAERPLRIAHIVAHAGVNGVATSCRSLIDAQLAAGHDILLASRPGSWLGQQEFHRPIERLESDLATTPSEIRRVGYAIRDWNLDVVHCHGSRANKYGMVFRIVAGTPVVATAHNTNFQLPWMFFHAILAPSRRTARTHRLINGVSGRKIRLIPNFVDLRQIQPPDNDRKRAARTALGLDADAFVIGFVGSIDRRKNQVDALRVLKHVAAAHPAARLVLIGSIGGPEPMPGWRELASDPLVAPRLVVTGHRNDALDLMPAFDLFLCTSREEQGPIAPMEAMAMELPIVTYDVGDLETKVDDGLNGYLLKGGDVEGAAARVLSLAHDPARARQMGAASRRKLEDEFSAGSILPRIDRVYREVMAKAGHRSG